MAQSARSLVKSRAGMLIALLLVFTILAVTGFAVFGLHPTLLRHIPELASLYGPAFSFFAQGHILLAFSILAVYLTWQVGRRWLSAFATVYTVSLASELVGTGFGLPFGAYHYTELLGHRWFGRVPWVIPLSWFSMVVPAYLLARQRFPARRQRGACVLIAALLFVIWDLSLDPAMSYLTSYWTWEESGAYYGMPLINLGGWYLTGVVLMLLLSLSGADRWADQISPRWMAAYFSVVLLMPLGMVIAAGLWGAVIATFLAFGSVGWLLGAGSRRRSKFDARGDFSTRPRTRSEAFLTVPDGRGVRAASAHVAPPQSDLADAFFRNHSRSFALASRLLPREQRRLVGYLYVFCRTTDDLVDQRRDSASSDVERELTFWIQRAKRAYEGQPSGLAWLDELMCASREAGVPFRLVRQLADGVRMDVGPVAIPTLEALEQYTYRVASVVGLWLCHLFGVTDPDTLKRAAAMGRAMQLTNILRDVGEDLQHDRIYIPASMMERYGVSRTDLHAMSAGGEITPAYRALIQHLTARADTEYEYAFPGLVSLPPAFGRASAAAAAVYHGIHDEIARNGYDNLRRRAFTSPLRKLWLAGRGLLRHQRLRRNAAPVPIATPITRRAREGSVGSLYFWAVLLSGIGLVCSLALPARTFADAPRGHAAEVQAAVDDDPWYDRLRSYYVRAVNDESLLEVARTSIAAQDRRDPLTRAYDAAFVVLRAKHAAWPHRKLRYLRQGLDQLDHLVRAHPSHVEIRYLRLLSCYFLPSFLGRGWSVERDFTALAENLPRAAGRFPPDLFEEMVRFVLQRGSPGPGTEARLRALLDQSDRDRTASSPRSPR